MRTEVRSAALKVRRRPQLCVANSARLRRAIFYVTALLSIMVGEARNAPTISAAESDLRNLSKAEWSTFAKALEPGPGFSITYNGTTHGPQFSSDWRITKRIVSPGSSGIDYSFTDRSGIQIDREVRLLEKFGAIEYKLHIKNGAGKALPVISNLESLHLSIATDSTDLCVVSSGGGMADGFFPPRSFEIRKNCFPRLALYPDTLMLTTEGGRSSNKDLPFFFIQDDDRNGGMFVAFGWSGQWSMSITREVGSNLPGTQRTTDSLNLTGKIPNLKIALQPGEKIDGPTVLLGFYTGTLADGSNRLRRLIREIYSPKLSNQTYFPAAIRDSFWASGNNFSESDLRTMVDGAAATKQEYFLLDAGWYAGTGQERFDISPGLGNWYRVDKKKLPNGLSALSNYVHSKGLKFGLWFEPERVASGSDLANDHPKWVMWKHEKELESAFSETNAGYGLLDLGRPDVQSWVESMLDFNIRSYGIDFIRYDFNIDPLAYWSHNDRSDGEGVTQIRYINGLYTILDWIRARHPNVVMEGCASGGRRIDLEAVRRFHAFWINDYSVDPEIIRNNLIGINHFLPGNYHNIAYTLPAINQDKANDDELAFKSMFGGAFGISSRMIKWPENLESRARLYVEEWKRLRRYLLEDYYPLGGQPQDSHSWSGWQFNDPSDQSGFIQTFRSNASEASHRFRVYGLRRDSSYLFRDSGSGSQFELLGAEAMTHGIEILQPPMSSKLFTYRINSTGGKVHSIVSR